MPWVIFDENSRQPDTEKVSPIKKYATGSFCQNRRIRPPNESLSEKGGSMELVNRLSVCFNQSQMFIYFGLAFYSL